MTDGQTEVGTEQDLPRPYICFLHGNATVVYPGQECTVCVILDGLNSRLTRAEKDVKGRYNVLRELSNSAFTTGIETGELRSRIAELEAILAGHDTEGTKQILRDNDDAIKNLKDQRDNQTLSFRQKSSKLRAHAYELETVIRVRNKTISDLRNQLDEKKPNKTIENLRLRITTKDADLDCKIRVIDDRDKTIAELARQVDERHVMITEQIGIIAGKDDALRNQEKKIIDLLHLDGSNTRKIQSQRSRVGGQIEAVRTLTEEVASLRANLDVEVSENRDLRKRLEDERDLVATMEAKIDDLTPGCGCVDGKGKVKCSTCGEETNHG